MATLGTLVPITDGVSPALTSMNKNLGTVVESFSDMRMVASSAFDTTFIVAMKRQLILQKSSYAEIGEEIIDVTDTQENFNESVEKSKKKTEGLLKSFQKFMAESPLVKGGKMLMGQADAYADTQVKLGSINDGRQTTQQLDDKIYTSANRARSSHSGMVDIVGKLGATASQSFGSNDEMIAFSELMAKSYKMGGASDEDQMSGMNQLTQAMAAGGMQEDDYIAVLENAPILAQSIASEMDVSLGKLKELSSQGVITSDVIKQALFNSADAINSQFEQMPMTFSDVGTRIKNEVSSRLQPAMGKVLQALNSPDGQRGITILIQRFGLVAKVIGKVIGLVQKVSSFISSNWEIIEPIVMGIVGAMLLYNGAILANTAISAVNMGIQTAQAIAQALKTGTAIADIEATEEMTVAQWALNSALLASPITWIILGIIALIAIIYAVVGAINKFAGTSLSATGIIMGSLAAAGAFIANLFLGMVQFVFGILEFWQNKFVAFANFMFNVFKDPIGAVIKLFGDLGDLALGVLEKIASGLDFIFGSKMADTIKGWRADLKVKTETAMKQYGNGKYEEKFKKMDINSFLDENGLSMERFDYGDSYESGYHFGENLEDKFSMDNMSDALEGFKDFEGMDPYKGLENVEENTYDTATNMAATKDSMEMSNEDLKYLRDLAAQKVINRFTTSEIKVDMANTFGNVSEASDLDGIIISLTEGLEEALAVAAEGAESDV